MTVLVPTVIPCFLAGGALGVGSSRGPMSTSVFGALSRQRLSTDAVGSATVSLVNVVVGSRYRIEVASTGALAEPAANAEGTAGATTVDVSLDRYAAGSANNDLRIKVRKGSSAPLYKPLETQTTISGGSQSVYIAQTPD